MSMCLWSVCTSVYHRHIDMFVYVSMITDVITDHRSGQHVVNIYNPRCWTTNSSFVCFTSVIYIYIILDYVSISIDSVIYRLYYSVIYRFCYIDINVDRDWIWSTSNMYICMYEYVYVYMCGNVSVNIYITNEMRIYIFSFHSLYIYFWKKTYQMSM